MWPCEDTAEAQAGAQEGPVGVKGPEAPLHPMENPALPGTRASRLGSGLDLASS